MNKKYIFSALALTAMLGACTNEEFEMVQNDVVPSDISVLDGRAKGNLVLSADRLGLIDNATRVDGGFADSETGTAINWFWRDNQDKLGGVVVDYAAGGTIVDLVNYPNYVITNYPFAPSIEGKSASASFTTPTAVVDGAYFFYSQYNGGDTDRRTIHDEISRLQTVRHGRDAGLIQIGSNQKDGGENFFISPIVNVDVADGSDVETPLSLTSAHGILHITLTAKLEEKYIGENGLKVNKVVLQTVHPDDYFYLETTVDPATLAKLQKTVYDNLKAANAKDPVLGAFQENGADMAVIDGEHEYAKEAQTAVLAELTRQHGGVPSIGSQVGATTKDLVYQLEEPFVYDSETAKMELFVILPTGTYQSYDTGVEYNGASQGALRMTVYTSEGTYDCYLGGTKDVTVYRNHKINIPRSLVIAADETNINLFDPNEGFKVETTEDYEYAIDYINSHYRDFGNASDWKAPTLNFVGNPEIKVREGYYFPTFRTNYNGNATLKLEVAEGKAYSFDPKKTILGTEKPTIVIEDKNSSITFASVIPAAGGTQSIELVSAGEVNLAHDITFDELTSTKAMNVADEVTVTINDAEAVASGALKLGAKAVVTANKITTNSIDLANEAKLTVADDMISNAGEVKLNAKSALTVAGTFDNSANVTVGADATATLNGDSENDATIIVAGKGLLKSAVGTEFKNQKNGVIEVQEYAVETLDNNARGTATFATLKNEAGAKIYVKSGSDLKGTYGALLTVTTLENAGEIFNNGEFNAEHTTNSGTITLQDNAYALINLNGDASLTDAVTGKGSLVLAAPTKYEMFDNFFTGRNNLALTTGVIETKLDKDTYAKVLKNHRDYPTQESALEVLNKITIEGEAQVAADELAHVDFVLANNAKLNATENITINSLTVINKADLTECVPGNATVTVTINEKLNVNADFAVASTIEVVLPANSEELDVTKPYWGALNIYAGTFTNNGSVQADADGPLFTSIAKNSKFVNKGDVGTCSDVEVKYYSADEIAIINAINAAYKAFQGYWVRTKTGNVDKANASEWGTATKLDAAAKTVALFRAWIASGAGEWFFDGTDSYKVYVTEGDYTPATVDQVVKDNAATDYKYHQTVGAAAESIINGGAAIAADTKVIKSYTAATLSDYMIVRTNNGTIDMTGAKKTVGAIVKNNGTKAGEFYLNVLESDDFAAGVRAAIGL